MQRSSVERTELDERVLVVAGSDADKQSMRKVALEASAQDLVCRELDVVFDSFEFEALLVRIVDRVTGAVVEVARLTHRSDRHYVLLVGGELEIDCRHLFDAVFGQREHLAQMRVADERDVAELLPERQTF